MPSEPSTDKVNQTIIEGITVSASTAILYAQQHKVPLVIWANDQITEISPTTLSVETSKPAQ